MTPPVPFQFGLLTQPGNRPSPYEPYVSSEEYNRWMAGQTEMVMKVASDYKLLQGLMGQPTPVTTPTMGIPPVQAAVMQEPPPDSPLMAKMKQMWDAFLRPPSFMDSSQRQLPTGEPTYRPATDPVARSAGFLQIQRMPTEELAARVSAFGITTQGKSREQLEQDLNNARLDVRPDEGGVLNTIAAGIAQFGLGGAKFINQLKDQANRLAVDPGYAAQPGGIDVLTNDIFERLTGQEHAANWLSKLDESSRMASPEEYQTGLTITGGVGQFAAGIAVGSAVFRGVNAALGLPLPASLIGSRLGPMARGALAGGITSLALDAGSDKPWLPSMQTAQQLLAEGYTTGERVLMGADLVFGNRLGGAVVGEAIGAVLGRVGRSFPTGGGAADEAGQALVRQEILRAQQAQSNVAPGFDPYGGAPDWEVEPNIAGTLPSIEPYMAPPDPGAPPQNMNDTFLRRLPPGPPEGGSGGGGEGGGGAPVAPVRDEFGNLSLTGPLTDQAEGRISSYLTSRDRVQQQLAEAVEDGTNQNRIRHLSELLQHYNRRIDGLVKSSPRLTGNEPPAAAVAQQQLRLTGPLHPEVNSQVARYRDDINKLWTQIEAARNSGDTNLAWKLSRHVDNLNDAIQRLELTGERQISTVEDIRDRYLAIRERQLYIEQQQGTGFRNSDEWQDLEFTRKDLAHQAGVTPNSKELPFSYWDKFRADPTTPATPAYELANQFGTIVRTPDGRPRMMFHGTAATYGEIDPQRIALSDNLAGPGFYMTDNPIVAGGDWLNPATGTTGYAGGRTNEAMREIEFIESELAEWRKLKEQQMSGQGGLHNIDTIDQSIQELETKLASIPQPAPQVRPYYVLAKNLFDFDGPMPAGDLADHITRLASNPDWEEWDFGALLQEAQVAANFGGHDMTGEILYEILTRMPRKMEYMNPKEGGSFFGPQRAVKALESLGYDGVIMQGGKRIARSSPYGGHTAISIFNPRNVISAYMDTQYVENAAAALGIQMTKQQIIMDSPVMPDITATPKIDDSTVVAAMVTSEPGGVHLLRGVENPAELLMQLSDAQFNGSLDNAVKSFRPVLHPSGRIDLLVSSFGNVTEEMANDYARTGFFSGMTVLKPNGQEARVTNVFPDGKIRVQTLAQAKKNKPGNSMDPAKLQVLPQIGSSAVMDAPDLYRAFKKFAVTETNARRAAMGQAPVENIVDMDMPIGLDFLRKMRDLGIDDDVMDDIENIYRSSGMRVRDLISPTMEATFGNDLADNMDSFGKLLADLGYTGFVDNGQVMRLTQVSDNDWFDDLTFSLMPQLQKEFLDRQGIADPGMRAAIARGFDEQRIADAKNLEPQLFNALDETLAELEVVRDALREVDPPAPHEYAALRGFNLVPIEGAPGFVLEDQFSDFKRVMRSEDDVIQFLNTFQRDLPDGSPAHPVPVELGVMGNDTNMHGTPDGDTFLDGVIEDMATQEEMLDEMMYGMESEPYDPPMHPEGGYLDEGGGPADWSPHRGGTEPSSNFRPSSGGGSIGGGPPEPPRMGGGFREPDPRFLPPGERSRRAARKERIRADLHGKAGSIAAIMAKYDRMIWRVFTHMRPLFADLEDQLMKIGVNGLRPLKDFESIDTGMVAAHNEANPILQKIGESLLRVDKKWFRHGNWWRVYEIENPFDRLDAGLRLGMRPDEVKVFDEVDQAIRDMYGDAYEDTLTQFKRYVARVRTEQHRGDFTPDAYGDPAEWESIRHYVDHARDTNANYLVNDPRILLADFVRSYQFAKHVADPWNAAHATWSSVRNIQIGGRRPYAALGDEVLDWLDFVQRGYEPGPDLVASTVQTVFNSTIGKVTGPITRGEGRAFIRNMQTGFYKGKIGLRPHVMIRDSLQPLMALPWVGPKHLGAVYRDMLSKKKMAQIIARQERGGIFERAMPQVESPGVFEGALRATAEVDEAGSMIDERATRLVDPRLGFTDRQMAARERTVAIGDALSDMIPVAGRQGVRRVIDAPLSGYTKQGVFHRIIVGEAAYRKFMQEWADWTKTRQELFDAGMWEAAPGYDDLANRLGIHAFEDSQKRLIEDMLHGIDTRTTSVEDAAYHYGKLITSTTQYDYGSRYVPKGTRSTAGRLGMMLGNFSIQTGRYVRYAYRAAARHPTARGKARWAAASLGTMGGIYAGLELAQAKTGWNFRGMHPLWSLVTSGGPVLEAAANTVLGAADVTGDIQGVINSREMPRNAKIDFMTPVRAVGSFANEINPLGGIGYHMQALGDIQSAPNPWPVAAEAFMTGRSHLGPSVQGQMIQQIEAMAGHAQNNSSLTPVNPRTANPGVRLPGATQFSGPEQGPARQGFGAMRQAGQDSILDQMARAAKGTHGAGGGAF